MIHHTTLDGRPVTVLFLNSAFEPVEQSEATLVRVNFTDAEGGSMFLVPDRGRQRKDFDPNQPRDDQNETATAQPQARREHDALAAAARSGAHGRARERSAQA